MAHLAMASEYAYIPLMPKKPKHAPEDTRSQRQKFIDKAREIETDDSPDVFDRVLKRVASAPVPKDKKPAGKRK